ncbi:MAG: hypothetical protein ACOCYW_09380, partial [Roseicyclus sp.]
MIPTASRGRLRAAGLALALVLPASGTAAQNWQPPGQSDPFPPSGTRICAEGGGARICLALFCPGPDRGLRIGWLDTTRVVTETAELNLSVDDPLAASDVMNPDARLVRLPRYPYFVATGTLNPDRAADLLSELRAGAVVTVEEAGNGIDLPLRGSGREIARVLEICGPPATDPVWDDGPAGEDAPPAGAAGAQASAAPATGPTEAPSATAFAVSGQGAEGAAPSPAAGAVSGVPAPQPAPGPEPAIAARWAPVPEDPAEEATGTELCFGDALDPAPLRCLRVGCFAPGDPAILWWQDEGLPASGGMAPLVLASPGGEAE